MGERGRNGNRCNTGAGEGGETKWAVVWRERDAHDVVEAGAIIAGGGGDAGTIAGGRPVSDETGLCSMIWVIASENETFVCAFCGEFRNETRRLLRWTLIALLSVHSV